MSRETARALAAQHLSRGDPHGWFEALYQLHRDEPAEIPWADARSNPNFIEWIERANPPPSRACVVGCGLGDDARALEQRGFAVTAFDISPTAIEMCRRRFPHSRIDWEPADIFSLPRIWLGAFPLVVSLNTLQVLPFALRRRALECIRNLVAPGGSLLLIVRGRNATDAEGAMPWPLLREELDSPDPTLTIASFDDYLDSEDPPVRRFRVHYTSSR